MTVKIRQGKAGQGKSHIHRVSSIILIEQPPSHLVGVDGKMLIIGLGEDKDILDVELQSDMAETLGEFPDAKGHVRQLLLGEQSGLGMSFLARRSTRFLVSGFVLSQALSTWSPMPVFGSLLEQGMDET